MTDASGHPVLGQLGEAGQQPDIEVEVQRVAVDDGIPPRVGGDNRVVERRSEDRGRPPVQRVDPDVLYPAVVDEAPPLRLQPEVSPITSKLVAL